MTPLDSFRRPGIVSRSTGSRVRPSRRKKLRRALLSIFVVVTVAVILGATSERFTNLLMMPLTENQSLRKSDVIIVLGAGSRSTEPHLPPQADARVQTSVNLLSDGWAPRMIVAGGYNKHTGYTEAPLMAAVAVADGAPSTKVIQEPTSKDTWENAANSLAIMKKNGWKTALVVTSPYHTWRSCMIFKKQMADVHCVAAPMRTERSHTVYEHLMDFRSVVREYGAIVYFFLRRHI